MNAQIKNTTSRFEKIAGWIHAAILAAIFCAIIASFYDFKTTNSERIQKQNQRYIADITLQGANHIGDMLNTLQKDIEVLALAVSKLLTGPYVDENLLRILQDISVFDYIEFIDPKGINHTVFGEESDASDRKNFIEGMNGESGVNITFNSRITHETIISYFAPLIYNGRIIGVLNGLYRESNLRKLISLECQGVKTMAFVCGKDGTIFSSTGHHGPLVNIFQEIKDDTYIAPAVMREIKEAFAAHSPLNFIYKSGNQNVSASLMPIPYSDWMLMQMFPPSVAQTMEQRATAAGAKLQTRLIIIFILYLLYIVLRNLQRRRQLTSEKARLQDIVQAITPLFKRFVVVDYINNTYEYLQYPADEVPASGSLAELAECMAPRFLKEEGENFVFPLLRKDAVQKDLKENKPYLQYEYRIHWENGDRWETASVFCLERQEGKPVIVLFAIQDVTDIKMHEQKVRDVLRDAFHAVEDLSRAKSDFLGRVSHDMRTPMNAVLGMTAIALLHIEDKEKVEDCLEKINSAASSLLVLINDMLDMSKIENGALVLEEKPICLTELVERLIKDTQSRAEEKSITFEQKLGPYTHIFVYADEERLYKVIFNVLDNAVKYTQEKGDIFFQAQELPSQESGVGRYEFLVKDNGIGMEPEFSRHIFEPFIIQDPNSTKQSIGLGLPISKAIVKLMNGSIVVRSKPGEGSTFIITVFLKLQQPDDILPIDNAVEDIEEDITRHAGIRALFVDDNEMNRDVARDLLEMAGIEIEDACNGQEAVAMAASHEPRYYDVILMDLRMPVMDGYQATATIRAMNRKDLKEIAIIAISANTFTEDIEKAIKSGMNCHISKPIDLHKILAALDKFLK